MRTAPLAATLLLLTLLGAHQAQSQLSRSNIDTVGSHVVRVMSPGPTAWTDTNGWQLVLERIIQPKEGERGALENPTGIVLLRDGRAVISQRQPATIRLYDIQGHFVREISREGEGPGEIRRPLVTMYGDTIVAFDAGRGRVTMLTLEGKRVREFMTDTHADGPPISLDSRGRLRIETARIVGGTVLPQWFYFDLTGKRLDSLVPPQSVSAKSWTVKKNGGIATYSIPFAAKMQHVFRSDGAILYGAWDRYQFFLTRKGNDTLLTFGRTRVASVPIPSRTRDSLFKFGTRNPEVAAVASKDEIPTTYPLWNEATFDGSGNLWVSSGLGRLGTLHFDVFASSGRFLGAASAPFPPFSRTSWTTDRVAVIGTDANDYPIIRIYRIDRRGK